MHTSFIPGSLLRAIVLPLSLIATSAMAAEATVDGESLYRQRCATCHEQPVIERTPPRTALRDYAPEIIVAALTSGVMQPQAAGLSPEEIRGLATFLSAKPFGGTQAARQPNLCSKPASPLDVKLAHWNGWSRDIENTRLQPQPGLSASDIPRLKVKWAYAYAGRSAYGQPTLVGDRVFVGNSLGELTALDAATGCAHWIAKASGAGIKAAVTVASLPPGAGAKSAVLYGDEKAVVHAVDAETGKLLWEVKVDDHAVARISGAPKLFENILYVPVSSIEEPAARDPKYPCCTFRGNVIALEIATGKVLWKAYAIAEAPKPFKKTAAGTQMFGPAGAAIWSSPTVDSKRRLLYVATGNSYTDVDNEAADSVVAFDLKTGARRWVNQVTPDDNFIMGCPPDSAGKNNCPESAGPDHDLGASPILETLPNGKQIILAGQKSGVVYGLDPDANGKTVWQTRVGHGSALGGVEWGPAADNEFVYVAIADAIGPPESLKPGLSALKIATGETVWSTPTPAIACSFKGRCNRGQPGAVTVMPGAVFSGALDGHIRAYDTKTGAILWDFDTTPARDTVNGIRVEGGSIDAGGTTIANGVVYVNSGYGIWGKMGWLLLAFSVDGK